MNCLITYEQLKPDTVRGYAIQIKQTYSSFDKAEIDDLEKNLEKSIGAGIIGGKDEG